MKTVISLFILLVVFSSLALVGCAGNGSSIGGSPGSYAGSYDADFTLDGDRAGALSLTVASDGSASGTLIVSTPPRMVPSTEAEFSFTAGTIQISGEVNGDGSFSLTGTDPNSGSFTVTGNLPANGSGTGTVTITAGGMQYHAEISVHQGGGTGSLKFSDVTAGINSADFGASPYIIISHLSGNYSIVAIPSAQDNSRSFVLNIDSSVVEGDSVDLSTASSVGITYRDTTSNDVDWNPVSGILKIVKLSPTSIELEFKGIEFTSDDASGSFEVNGTLKK